MGVFAFLRILFPIFYEYCYFYKDYIIFLFFISLVHSSFVILSIYDVKKIIAYFSIIHMNFSMIGFFTFIEVVEDNPKELWNMFQEAGGIDEADFFEYFKR